MSVGFGQAHGGVIGTEPEHRVQLGQFRQVPQLAQLYTALSAGLPL
jgi:hypothetical protein